MYKDRKIIFNNKLTFKIDELRLGKITNQLIVISSIIDICFVKALNSFVSPQDASVQRKSTHH